MFYSSNYNIRYLSTIKLSIHANIILTQYLQYSEFFLHWLNYTVLKFQINVDHIATYYIVVLISNNFANNVFYSMSLTSMISANMLDIWQTWPATTRSKVK